MSIVKKYDKVISIAVLLGTFGLVFLVTRPFFLSFYNNQMLLGGFIKFFLLASIGDFIGLRLQEGVWRIPKNMFYKALVWGVIGIFIVMMFTIFPLGVSRLQEMGILPFLNSVFFHALFTSIMMNIIFAPTMMLFHRISDTMLNGASSLEEAVNKINWHQFVSTVLCKTIPFFWIPAHTITFLIPEEYRVLLAAILGIVLGLLLRILKK